MRITLNPFKKYRNVFYYIFHYSSAISLIPVILGIVLIALSLSILSILVGVILVLTAYIYEMIIFDLIERYLWKRAKGKELKNKGSE